MNVHLHNSPELQKQHQAHKERAVRLGGISRQVVCFVSTNPNDAPDAHVRQRRAMMGKDANAHVMVWRRLMLQPVDLDVMFVDDKKRVDNSAWKHVSAVKYIVSVVAAFYNVSVRDILSQRRSRDVVKPRQIAMYLAKTLTIRSLPEIGRIIGGRDHSTILHGIRKITRELEKDRELARDIAQITRVLMESAHADA